MRNKKKMSALITPIQHNTGSSSQCDKPKKKKKEIKGINIEKEDIKPSLFADDIMTYAGNLTESTKKKI